MTVRDAAPRDLDALVTLALEARGESPLTAQVCPPAPEVLRQYLAGTLQVDDVYPLIASVDGAVTGFALARLVRPGLFCDVGWLQVEAMFVARDHRRRGVGHGLMSALANLAAAESAKRVVTTPLSGSRSEQRFLARLGFAQVAGHRVADTAALLRRLDLDLVPRDRRRPRGLESLIAARRRSRGVGGHAEDGASAGLDSPDELPLAAS